MSGNFLTPELHKHIVTLVRGGIPLRHISKGLNVSYTTFHKWRVRGQAEESGKYHDLWIDICRAESESITERVQVILDAAQGKTISLETRKTYDAKGTLKGTIEIKKDIPPKWEAAAWLLARVYPEFRLNNVDTVDTESDNKDGNERVVIYLPENSRGLEI